jgi:adenylylsulfate kinase
MLTEDALMESHTRSITKAVSYRFLGSAVTALIIFVLTGKGGLSLKGGALDMVLKIAAYFVHERIWDRIEFGRSKPPEYEI